MNDKNIKQIFQKNNIIINSIEKINIGFTNEIYSINNKYILRVCKKKSNEKNFIKEVFLLTLFKDKIPVPKIIYYDTSKKVINKYFMICDKIEGDNLYSKWHLLNDLKRRNVIKEICNILRIINNTDYNKFAKEFRIKIPIDLQILIGSSIKKNLKKVQNKKILNKDFINKIKGFVEINLGLLKEQKLSLVYEDIHFDNILVKNNHITGILDLEGIELMSIDYTLSCIRRMVNYPKIYASESSEKFIKKQDYSNLLKWYKEFYPELFNFHRLDKRLNIYDIDYDLHMLLQYPKSEGLKKRLSRVLK